MKLRSQYVVMFFLLIGSIETEAQNYSFYSANPVVGYIYQPIFISHNVLIDNDSLYEGIKIVNTETKRFKNNGEYRKRIISKKYEYDAERNLLRYSRFKNNEIKEFEEYTYTDGIISEKRSYNKRNKMTRRTTQKFENGHLVEYSSFKDSTKKPTKHIYARNEAGKVTDYKRFENGKLHYHIVYEYHENGDLKKTTSYNKRGKISHIYEYECDPRGQEIESKKESEVCISHTALKNGGEMIVTLTTDKEGEHKSIRYTNADSQIKKLELYYPNMSQIHRVSTYDYNGNTWGCVRTMTYRKNGSQAYEYENRYENNDYYMKQNTFNRKGEVIYGFSVKYNKDDSGRIKSITTLDEEGEKTKETSIMYFN